LELSDLCFLAQMATTDGSSVISEERRSNIAIRDGGLCVLCGEDPVDVAHIVARKAGDTGQVAGTSAMYRLTSTSCTGSVHSQLIPIPK